MSKILEKAEERQTGRTTRTLLCIDKFPAVFIVEHGVMRDNAIRLCEKHLKVEKISRVGCTVHTDKGDIRIISKEKLEDPYWCRGLIIKQVAIDHYAQDCPWSPKQREGLWKLRAQIRRG